MSFWEAQRQIATNDLIDHASAIGRAWRDKQEQAALNAKARAAYLLALEKGKTTGFMPCEFQKTATIDVLGRQMGLNVVALRELAKYAPNHPLVISAKCREIVGSVTLLNYNLANRPDIENAANLTMFAPDDGKSQAIFKAYPGTPQPPDTDQL